MEAKSSLRLNTFLEVGDVLTKEGKAIKSVLLESKAYRQANCSKSVDKIVG